MSEEKIDPLCERCQDIVEMADAIPGMPKGLTAFGAFRWLAEQAGYIQTYRMQDPPVTSTWPLGLASIPIDQTTVHPTTDLTPPEEP